MDVQKLKALGYSADPRGIVCSRGAYRFSHECTALIWVQTSKDTPAARALIDGVIAAIDQPRVLSGRDRRGGVIMLFRVDPNTAINNARHEYALRTGEKITLVFGSDGMSVNPDEFNWPKGRSPLDVPRDQLPPWYDRDFRTLVLEAARAAGALSIRDMQDELAQDERHAQIAADVASGKIKIPTEEERQAKADEEIVKEYEGREFVPSDGNGAQQILAARGRFARWLARKTTAAETQG